MTLFLLTFFLLYGGMHCYAFLRMSTAFSLGPQAGLPLGLLMAFMTAAPVLVRRAEKAGLEELARVTALGGYFWMAALFLFVCALSALDIWRLLIRLSEALSGRVFGALHLQPRSCVLAALIISMALCAYGSFEASAIRTEHVRIETEKLPSGAEPLTVVQISDVHLGLIVREARLRRILAAAEGARPDLLVSTGDLVDGQTDELNGLTEIIRRMNPKHGMFAVTGNHEFYAGLGHSLDFTEKAGFRILRGEAVSVGRHITIAGVDDSTADSFGKRQGAGERELLSSLPPDRFTILLKHRPLVDESSCGLFDLQLSGHTHRGQIFPFGILTGLRFPANSGTVEVGQECLLHVSRGSGTWGPPVRVLSPPEVTVIEVVGRG